MRIISFIAIAIFALTACKTEGGLKTTDSGYSFIQHTNLKQAKPNPGDWIYFDINMRNRDEVVYSSKEQGQTPFFRLPDSSDSTNTAQESPIADVAFLIGEGDSVTIIIRLDTLPQKPQGFEDTDTLFYDMLLTEVKTDAEFQVEAQAEMERKAKEREESLAREPEVAALVAETLKGYQAGNLAGVQTTESGLKYVIHEEGTGATAEAGKLVEVHYYGVLEDGSMFDNSLKRGEAFRFPLGMGRVIPGWDEGIALLKEGSKGTFFIPYQLAYGEAGSPPVIPEKAELIFYVELLSVGSN